MYILLSQTENMVFTFLGVLLLTLGIYLVYKKIYKERLKYQKQHAINHTVLISKNDLSYQMMEDNEHKKNLYKTAIYIEIHDFHHVIRHMKKNGISMYLECFSKEIEKIIKNGFLISLNEDDDGFLIYIHRFVKLEELKEIIKEIQQISQKGIYLTEEFFIKRSLRITYHTYQHKNDFLSFIHDLKRSTALLLEQNEWTSDLKDTKTLDTFHHEMYLKYKASFYKERFQITYKLIKNNVNPKNCWIQPIFQLENLKIEDAFKEAKHHHLMTYLTHQYLSLIFKEFKKLKEKDWDTILVIKIDQAYFKQNSVSAFKEFIGRYFIRLSDIYIDLIGIPDAELIHQIQQQDLCIIGLSEHQETLFDIIKTNDSKEIPKLLSQGQLVWYNGYQKILMDSEDDKLFITSHEVEKGINLEELISQNPQDSGKVR